VEISIDMLKRIRSQVKVMVMASNINEIHLRYLRDEIPQLFNLFDYHVFSCRAGFLKPEDLFWEEIREYLYWRKIGLEECIFVDDVQENILGALKFGFSNVFWYFGENRVDRLEEFLFNLGINV
jgi:FMN phosphatase YigB (HAD superfamily)